VEGQPPGLQDALLLRRGRHHQVSNVPRQNVLKQVGVYLKCMLNSCEPSQSLGH
jgi:hypothetical protein